MRGSLFVHELTEVRPGTAIEYLEAVRNVRAPLMAEYGHHLVGLYEVMMNDYEVCTTWATDAEAHVRMGKARDVARGLADAEQAGVAAMTASRTGTARLVPGRRDGGRN